MRNILQITFLLLFTVGTYFSQGDISIVSVDDMSTSLNGTTVEVSGNPSDINIYKDLRIVNDGNEAITISYKRTRLVDDGVLDQICDEFLCHDADDNDTYITPIEVTVQPGENTEFKPQIVPDGKEVCVYNKYEVVTPFGVVFDEITIKYTSGNANCLLNTNNELSLVKHFEFYPNPAQEDITVMYDSKDQTSLQITDALGKTVVNKSIFSGSKIVLNELNNGVYFVQLITKEGIVERKKLIVKR